MRARSAEQVRAGHPDKLCDQIADALLDAMLRHQAETGGSKSFRRAGIEVLAKDLRFFVAGEVRAEVSVLEELDVEAHAKAVCRSIGYAWADQIEVENHIGLQQPELQASSDRKGAGDQGIMVGYATNETMGMIPLEHALASRVCEELDNLIGSSEFPWILPDGKAQVVLDASSEVTKVIIGAQHTPEVFGHTDPEKIQSCIREQLIEEFLLPGFDEKFIKAEVIVNGTGSFSIGGPVGDAGLVGRKIVCDAYGPNVPVGGGAFSGKDPTKVDRSAAYFARKIAKHAVAENVKGAASATVQLAYAIGQHQPEMIHAVTDTGKDLESWVRSNYPDLSPEFIAYDLDLWRESKSGWSYQETARYGHFGRMRFPWEQVG